MLVASEILTTGWCPLNCKYCYIPKSDRMKLMHQEIIDRIKSGEMFDTLEKIYGERLEYLGFWGTEPTLTLDLLGEKVPEIVSRFPKLKEFSLSTNMMMDPGIILRFARNLGKLDKSMDFKVQISLDGPAWITDKNRMEDAARRISENWFELVNLLNSVDLGKVKVKFKWKATHSIENMKGFIEHPERITEYKKFFETLNAKFFKRNKNENVQLMKGSYIPTLVVPGKYTSEDGKVFAEYLRLAYEIGLETTYPGRLKRLFDNEGDMSKRRQFSCSGGDSNLGVGREVHICHRTFYLNDEKYVQSILDQQEIENWDVSLFRKGTIDFIRRWYIVDPYDEDEFTRFQYIMRGYHDFWRFQIGYIHTMLIELALAGQADPIYLESEIMRELFALFINVSISCPMENLLNTGSVHLQVVSLLRLFANGAFQEILKEVRGKLR